MNAVNPWIRHWLKCDREHLFLYRQVKRPQADTLSKMLSPHCGRTHPS